MVCGFNRNGTYRFDRSYWNIWKTNTTSLNYEPCECRNLKWGKGGKIPSQKTLFYRWLELIQFFASLLFCCSSTCLNHRNYWHCISIRMQIKSFLPVRGSFPRIPIIWPATVVSRTITLAVSVLKVVITWWRRRRTRVKSSRLLRRSESKVE